jgi:ABC-2 type transport system ATP-binding protein
MTDSHRSLTSLFRRARQRMLSLPAADEPPRGEAAPGSADVAVVRFRDVTHRYRTASAVQALSFAVGPGEMFGLIGPDGAGKTTTIRLMAGLIAPAAGVIRVLGHDPRRSHRPITEGVGYLSQRFSLYGDLSLDENLAFFAEIHGVRDHDARRARLLDLTQLTPFRHRLTDRLSGGMKQKLALACTLIHQPDLILLDEPTTGVDPVSRREFWKLLSEFRQQGLTIVMATPYLDEAERCSRVALLHEGRLLALDDPTRLRNAARDEVFEVVASPAARLAAVIASIDDIEDAQTYGERVHVRLRTRRGEPARAWLADALTGRGLERPQVRRVTASLEDVFIDRIRHASAPADASARPAGS